MKKNLFLMMLITLLLCDICCTDFATAQDNAAPSQQYDWD